MKRILAMALAIACLTAAQAEVVVEFDGKTWQGVGEGADFKQRVRNEGLCLVADDSCKVGEVLKGWEFERFERRSSRFALRGVEGKGALIASGEAITVDDDFPGLNAELKTDIDKHLPGVDPAVADQRGRIVINFRNDGSTTGEDGEVLTTDDEVRAHITNQRDAFAKLGKQPVLFLRGEKEAVFRHCRRVIRLGAEVEVTNAIFAVYPKPEN